MGHDVWVEGGREGGREEGREGGKEGGREGGKEGEREGGREGEREREGGASMYVVCVNMNPNQLTDGSFDGSFN